MRETCQITIETPTIESYELSVPNHNNNSYYRMLETLHSTMSPLGTLWASLAPHEAGLWAREEELMYYSLESVSEP